MGLKGASGVEAILAAMLLALSARAASAEGSAAGDPLAFVLAPFKAQASADQQAQLSAAIAASPALREQLVSLARKGTLQAIRLGDPAGEDGAPGGPFGAYVKGSDIVLSAQLLEAEKHNRLFDVVIPNEIWPNNLVFALGRLAYHAANPGGLHPEKGPNPPKDQDAYVSARILDVARADAQGWNDVVDAAKEANHGKRLTVPQIGSLLMNLRYRAAFLKAQELPTAPLEIPNTGIIAGEANIAAIAQALRSLPLDDVE